MQFSPPTIYHPKSASSLLAMSWASSCFIPAPKKKGQSVKLDQIIDPKHRTRALSGRG